MLFAHLKRILRLRRLRLRATLAAIAQDLRRLDVIDALTIARF
jgi:hypothetical protein